MGQVLVRNLDDQVIESLRRRAAAHGHSLEQELRLVLTAAAQPNVPERLALVDRVRALSGPTGIDSTALVREDRDR